MCRRYGEVIILLALDKLIEGCLGEYSALNGVDSDNTKSIDKVSPIKPFFKIIIVAKSGEKSCFDTNWCS